MSPPTLILQISCKETASHFSGPEYSKVKAANPFYIFLLLSVNLMKRRPEPVCGSQRPVHLFLLNTQILRNESNLYSFFFFFLKEDFLKRLSRLGFDQYVFSGLISSQNKPQCSYPWKNLQGCGSLMCL